MAGLYLAVITFRNIRFTRTHENIDAQAFCCVCLQHFLMQSQSFVCPRLKIKRDGSLTVFAEVVK